MALDGVRHRAGLGDLDVEHVLLGVLDGLGNSQGHLSGLAEAEAHVALAVADDDQSEQRHTTAALDYFGNAADGDNALLELRYSCFFMLFTRHISSSF